MKKRIFPFLILVLFLTGVAFPEENSASKLNQTAKVFNNTGPKIVIDGGGRVTLSGAGLRRILYMNTCDPNQIWTTAHCQNQDHPQPSQSRGQAGISFDGRSMGGCAADGL